MVLCFVPKCNHRSEAAQCKMFRFPQSPRKKRLWKSLIRRKHVSPGKNARVCSCHFEGKDRSNPPSMFAWKEKKMVYSSPEPKKTRAPRKRKKGSEGREHCADGSNEEEIATVDEMAREGSVPNTSEPDMEISSSEENCAAADGVEENIPSTSSYHLSNLRRRLFVSSEPDVGDITSNPFLDQSSQTADLEDPEKTDVKIQLEAMKEENAQLKKQLEAQAEETRRVRHCYVIAEAEKTLAESKIKELEAALAASRSASHQGHKVITFDRIKDDDELLSHLTALPNRETFDLLLEMFDGLELKYFSGWRVTSVPRREQLLLTLIKLRRGMSHIELEMFFGVHRTTVGNIFKTWLSALHEMLVNRLMKKVPSRHKNQKYLPEAFKNNYENTRIVLDCTEVGAENPTLLSKQNQFYSQYKGKITLKGLVGIAPNGTVTYVSRLYPGRTTDKDIVAHSKVLDVCEPGDIVKADKGFLILPLLPRGVALNIPPFKETPQFTPEQIAETKSIARARIHIERAIQRIKMFRILDFIPQHLIPYASDVFRVCAALTNLRKPLLKDIYNREQEK